MNTSMSGAAGKSLPLREPSKSAMPEPLKYGDPQSIIGILCFWTVAFCYYVIWHQLLYIGGRNYRISYLVLFGIVIGTTSFLLWKKGPERAEMRRKAFAQDANVTAQRDEEHDEAAGIVASTPAAASPAKTMKLVCPDGEAGGDAGETAEEAGDEEEEQGLEEL